MYGGHTKFYSFKSNHLSVFRGETNTVDPVINIYAIGYTH